MRKLVVLFAWAVLCADARRRRPYEKVDRRDDNFPEAMMGMKRADNPDHSDPAADIPDLSQLRQMDQNSPVKDKESDKPPHMWFDFVGIHDRNIQKPPPAQRYKPAKGSVENVPPPPPPPPAATENKNMYFSPHSYNLKKDTLTRYKPINWTTCEEFRKTAKYDPQDIIDKKWIPFYVWSSNLGKRAFVHVFQPATEMAVKHYYSRFRDHLNKTVDWLQHKLVLMEGHDMEYLLIAGDQKGLYYMIPNLSLPEYVIRNKVVIPLVPIRLKIEDPYLLFMFCDDNFAYIMAQLGEEPQTDADKKIEAEASGFRGKGRPVSRDESYERKMMEMALRKKQLQEARKYLPANPNYGLFPPELRDPPDSQETAVPRRG